MVNKTEENFEIEQPLLSEKHEKARVFEGEWSGESLEGFNAITLFLDGKVQSDLDWKKIKEAADRAIEAGYGIFWQMDLGLFEQLIHPLINQTQFLSLTLGLEYFRDTLWAQFKEHSVGLCFYRGNADFSRQFFWDDLQISHLKAWLLELGEADLANLEFPHLLRHEEGCHLVSLFCRDVILEYLTLLGTRVPDALPLFLCLDSSTISSCFVKQMSLLNPSSFTRFRLALKKHSLLFNAWGWQASSSQGYLGMLPRSLIIDKTPSIGICVPSSDYFHRSFYKGLAEGVFKIKNKELSYKLIAEDLVTSEWDGLDYLLFEPTALSQMGKRKLQGFCAAGGIAVSTGALIGLEHEITLNDCFFEEA